MEILNQADIGVFGGSGFYSFLNDVKEVKVDTPYGPTSDSAFIGTIGAHRVAFMPRHRRDHSIPPHQINYRANVWAMKHLGCTRVISPCAAGSLQKEVEPGNFVLCDQFVDWTEGRKNTFFESASVFEGTAVQHPSPAETYCPQLRQLAARAARELNLPFQPTGTVVVINGPRFSTKAESAFFTRQGWQVIGMTAFPETYLVKELNMCPLNISLITDYDAGLVGDVPPVSHEEVLKVFDENMEKMKSLLFKLIEQIPAQRTCGCAHSTKIDF